ncbi:unnamed protein product [Parascedosporium putredinis]|uniref:MT-A70-domain-containing protein n=1 Tax=Parascedosporium putredinis TaxID=1442378 RepID=A0A9P1GV96_9PEZI|nr:unnamed protein product [Parascedosporium putredinis]CAI7987721.1 unnamed protein product [Parascedosporium putredinis]
MGINGRARTECDGPGFPRRPALVYPFENAVKSVVCLDLPRSIEEAQAPRNKTTRRRLISAPALLAPFPTPAPKHAANQSAVASPAAQLSQLMTCAAAESALRDLELKYKYHGPFCLPRVVTRPESPTSQSPTPLSYFVPECSHALHGSIEEKSKTLDSSGPLFDLILMDPPWPNRSAKRKRGGYTVCHGSQDIRRLLSLIPVRTRLAPGGVVAVWVTNSQAMVDVLTERDGLFAEWDLEPAGEWIWLKVTANGEPMSDIHSTWRKPWERLLFARRKGDFKVNILDRKVILAVPDVHSRKPSFKQLFDEMMPSGYHALEVFARYLTADSGRLRSSMSRDPASSVVAGLHR